MPYKSEAQRGKFHELLKQGKISPAVVQEFDKASVGIQLPQHVSKSKRPAGSISRDTATRKHFFGKGRT